MTPTEKYLLEFYQSPTLTTEELAKVTAMKNSRSVLEAIRRGTFPIPTYRAGKLRLADVRDVARYLDKQRQSAADDAEQTEVVSHLSIRPESA